ncbi:hypothetical protein P7D85_14665 [Enterococcus hulanensis]|uniref:Phage protein n=1 Tax=Enterococcus hulanensis TaxID=2559929 RepID=A0ABU3F267_9ENTE|nr:MULTISPECIES: hypothetical protein [Enterococcus]MBX8939249.1 hypothetical protein [Enterococcus gilvus]MDT2601026.1 hypothetical protein [Enterococcus hulanensis]MDT2610492.1 hypothetical protein [Enterococcus hulanensis]MDT2617219.1 hypothetical protein [Enterococcus hulanensis]
MTDKEQELLKMYDSAFDGNEQQLSLVAIATFNRLREQHNKEEVRTIAEILKALATAPVV